jgi:hypothetical protein
MESKKQLDWIVVYEQKVRLLDRRLHISPSTKGALNIEWPFAKLEGTLGIETTERQGGLARTRRTWGGRVVFFYRPLYRSAVGCCLLRPADVR